jgi:hypothetical protein
MVTIVQTSATSRTAAQLEQHDQSRIRNYEDNGEMTWGAVTNEKEMAEVKRLKACDSVTA